jgi:hypothetical protein
VKSIIHAALVASLITVAACGEKAPKQAPDPSATKKAESIQSNGRRVDLASWAGKSREALSQEYAQLAGGETPSISSIGICNKVTIAFASGDGPDAGPEVLICDLDRAYDASTACDALGLRLAAGSTSEGAWQTLAPADDRILAIKCNSTEGGCTQILVQFKR